MIGWNILSLSLFIQLFQLSILFLLKLSNITSFFLLFIFFLSFLSMNNTHCNQKLLEVINRYAFAGCFLHLISLFRPFREFGQKLSEASKNRGNWLQESPSRSINLQRFWPICFVTIPFSKLSFYLSLRYVESSSRIKKTSSENPFLSLSGIIFSDLYCPIS